MRQELRIDVGVVERSRLRSRHLGARFDPLERQRAPLRNCFLFNACEKSVNKINNKCAMRARRDYGSMMHQTPGVPVATARLMDARIAALAAQLEAASLPRERERLGALLSALQTAFAARHGPTVDDSTHAKSMCAPIPTAQPRQQCPAPMKAAPAIVRHAPIRAHRILP